MRIALGIKMSGTLAAAILILTFLLAQPAQSPAQSAPGGYKLVNNIALPQITGWDYLTIDSEMRRLYISDNSGAVVMDIDTDRIIGRMPSTPFAHEVGLVHGVALAHDLNRGFLSHEIPPSVILFNLDTLAETGTAKTAPGTDAVVYDAFTRRVFTMNGKVKGVHNISAIDATNGASLRDIPLPGSPEFAVADGSGHLYVNIESKSELAQVDTRTLKILHLWPLAPCEAPGAMAIDAAHRRLFIGCDNKIMAMVDADSGKVLGTVATGDGVDAARFDPATGYAFASSDEGLLTIAHEDAPRQFTLVGNVKTLPGGRTMALDTKTHRVFVLCGTGDDRTAAKTPGNPHGYPVAAPATVKLLIFGR